MASNGVALPGRKPGVAEIIVSGLIYMKTMKNLKV